MILLRKSFSNKESEDKDKMKAGIGGVSLAAGAYGLSKTKTGRLTGKVTRYHDAPTEVIDKIKNEGLKAKYAVDPNNLTNRVVTDVPMEAKEGLVYTAKKKKVAHGVGITRAVHEGKITSNNQALKEMFTGKSPHHKVLKLEFDYDDLKGSKRIANPELRGAVSPESFHEKLRDRAGIFKGPEWKDLDPLQKKQAKEVYKALGDDTHVFKGGY